MAEHLETGLNGENAVADYLVSQGWRIVARRWRDPAPRGLRTDIDLIASSPDGRWHFVEVKTRGPKMIASPAEAVNFSKRQRLVATAEEYLIQNPLQLQPRFDILEIYLDGEGNFLKAVWLENAFQTD